jgi:KDO2-lipid IV(A) lauroyltransferase
MTASLPDGVRAPTALGWLMHQLSRPLLFALGVLPLGLGLWMARRGADCAYALGVRRRVLLENLEYVLPELSSNERRRVARLSLRNIGQMAVESVASLRTRAKALDVMEIENLPEIEELARSGQGMILTLAHSGNMDLTGRAWVELGHEANAVFKPPHSYYAFQFVQRLRACNGYATLSTRDPEIRARMNDVLARGATLVLLPDQNAHASGVHGTFLGRPVSTFKGVAAAYLEQAKPPHVVVVVDTRPNDDRRHFCQTRILKGPSLSGDREADVATVTQRINDLFGEMVRKHPGSYFWGHHRWGRKLGDEWKISGSAPPNAVTSPTRE